MIDEKKIQCLKDYFAQREDIAFAYVFGSQVKGTQTSESDVDIAIYFTPKLHSVEWEDNVYYDQEDEVWSSVETLLDCDVDLVILNRVPSLLCIAAVQEGTMVHMRNQTLFLQWFLLVSREADDFQEFVEDYWKIKQRSASLNPIDKQRLIHICDFLETELQDYETVTVITQREYETQASLRRNLERWVENIVNASIDIAKILLASEKKKIPSTYRQVLEGLELLDDFDGSIAKDLSKFAKLRNILAHDYLDIRFHHIKQFLENAEKNYEYILDYTKRIIE